MTLEPHEQRVIDEFNELYDKHQKLNAFIEGDKFPDLHEVNKSLLRDQYDVMSAYLEILEIRIQGFKA